MKESLYVLIHRLEHPGDEHYRFSVACELGKRGDPEAREALERVVLSGPDAVRMGAAEALGKLGERESRDVLILALDDPDVNVRARAVQALGRLGDGRAVPVIARFLADEKEVVARRHATRALGALGAVEPLLDLLSDSDYFVRLHAATDLGVIGDRRALDHLQRFRKRNWTPLGRFVARRAIRQLTASQ